MFACRGALGFIYGIEGCYVFLAGLRAPVIWEEGVGVAVILKRFPAISAFCVQRTL